MRLPAPIVMIGTVLLFFVFQAVGDDRGASLRESLGIEQPHETGQYVRHERFLEGMDFANLEYFEYVVYVVPQRSHTYDYFLSNLQLLTEPIPRVLWKDKPVGAPIQTVNFLQYGTPLGFTLSLPGVGWYELGWLGVAIWCALWGWLTGRVYEWFVQGEQSTLRVAIYIVSLSSLVIVYRDGTLLTLARGQLFYMLPLLVLYGARRAMKLPSLQAIRNWMQSPRFKDLYAQRLARNRFRPQMVMRARAMPTRAAGRGGDHVDGLAET
jgi:hypothetical protein